MTYQFKCSNCGTVKEVEASMQNGPPSSVTCPFCDHTMHRVWESAIHIPEYMKSNYAGASPGELGRRLNRTRPSGKRKVYF